MSFDGHLKPNEIFGSLFNMIISQQVFADNIKGTFSSLVNRARVDGGLHGDTKLYYGTDVLNSYPWKMDDPTSLNLLELHRPSAPKQQAIRIDQFRQIPLTVDYYLSKRAWMGDGVFSSFTGIMLGWIGETKRVYDSTKYNAFIGTDAPAKTNGQKQEWVLPKASETDEAANRLRAEKISQNLADLFVELGVPSRKFTDWELLRSYDGAELKVIWNSKYVNEIRKIDLPTIFHKEGLVDKFEEFVLPDVYFGTKATTELDVTSETNKGAFRILTERDLNKAKRSESNYDPALHLFPGDLIPAKEKLTGKIDEKQKTLTKDEYYTPNPKVIAKVYTELPPFMSAFETGTDFFNARNLSENHYLTFSHNTLEHLEDKPCIVITEK